MNEALRQLRDNLRPYRCQMKTISISHLAESQAAVETLVTDGTLSQNLSGIWKFYKERNDKLPEARTVILIATPVAVSRLHFSRQGKDYPAEIAAGYYHVDLKGYEARAEEIVRNVLQPAGYHVEKASPAFKSLAVRSGLAKYGKNSITYIPGMGSLLRYVAFYTDCPPEEDSWQEPQVLDECQDCSLCQEACPTGCILEDRFLIRAEKCLGFLNEQDPSTPYYARYQPGWPLAFIGCMTCQQACPVNQPYLSEVIEGPTFSEAETKLILSQPPWEKLTPEIQQKLEPVHRFYARLVPNLKELLDRLSRSRGQITFF